MRIILLACLLVAWSNLRCQTMTGNLKDYLTSYLNDIPGSLGNQYMIPSDQELDQWKIASLHLLDGELSQARSEFDLLNYDVIEFTDTSLDPSLFYYVLQEKESRQFYGGAYVITGTACSEFVTIQAPHSLFDTNTGLQAAYSFSRVSSGALMLAGTHRCNSNISSSCDGTTSVCGSSESYRESDLAHTEQSFFQAMTEVIAEYHPSSVFVQLHGFSKRDTDPYVIMSNGSRTTPAMDYSAMLRDELDQIDPSLTFRLAHVDQTWTRLIGFTNIQGRYLNNSAEPCDEEASVGSGRFIHVEQEREKLRENVEGWEKMALAIGRTFNCEITTSADPFNTSLKIYPLPSMSGIIHIQGKKLTRVDLYANTGTVLKSWEWSDNTSEITLNLSGLEAGLYLLKIEDKDVIRTKKIVLSHK